MPKCQIDFLLLIQYCTRVFSFTIFDYEKAIRYVSATRTGQYLIVKFCMSVFFIDFFKIILAPSAYICHFSLLDVSFFKSFRSF